MELIVPSSLLTNITEISLVFFKILLSMSDLSINQSLFEAYNIIFPPSFLVGYFFFGTLIYMGLVVEMFAMDVPILLPRDQELVECFFAVGVLIHSARLYVIGSVSLSC